MNEFTKWIMGITGGLVVLGIAAAVVTFRAQAVGIAQNTARIVVLEKARTEDMGEIRDMFKKIEQKLP